MKPVSLDLDREMESLDPPTALQFKQAVLAMLKVVKEQRSRHPGIPFSDRIARHPAIGTWPASVDADQHVDSLRNEWVR